MTIRPLLKRKARAIKLQCHGIILKKPITFLPIQDNARCKYAFCPCKTVRRVELELNPA